MASLHVLFQNSALKVESEDLADELGVDHDGLLNAIRKRSEKIVPEKNSHYLAPTPPHVEAVQVAEAIEFIDSKVFRINPQLAHTLIKWAMRNIPSHVDQDEEIQVFPGTDSFYQKI